MGNYTMEWSEERQTWNVIDLDYHEWIFEGNYEQCCSMMDAANSCEEEEYDD